MRVAAAALAAGAAPPFAVNVTNVGPVPSDVSALAFVSTGVPGEPLQRLFDFQRAASVAPGASVVLTFTLPPAQAAVVGADGARMLRAGGAPLSIAIGDVLRASGEERAGARVRARLLVTGDADIVLSHPPPQR